MSEKFETSKATGAHFDLSRLEGSWEGTATTWLEPDEIADESSVRGTMQLVLGGRFILHEYQGSFKGARVEGMAIYGYHLPSGKFQSAWIDSFHNGTAIMFSEGGKNDDRISVLGSYAHITPEEEQHWGWRTEMEWIADDELKITAYNISPAGEASKATETVYRKVNGPRR